MEKLNVAIADDNERIRQNLQEIVSRGLSSRVMRNSMSLELLKMGKRLTM